MPLSVKAGRKVDQKECGVVLTGSYAEGLSLRMAITASTLPRTPGSQTIKSLDTRNVAQLLSKAALQRQAPIGQPPLLSARCRAAAWRPQANFSQSLGWRERGGWNFETIAFRDSGRRRRRTSTRRLLARTIPQNGHPDQQPEP